MTAHHALVWLDHNEAHMFRFVGDRVEELDVEAKPHARVHNRAAASGRREDNAPYYKAILDALSECAEFVVVGPSTAKLELVKHLQAERPQLNAKLIGVETVDHPTDRQLIAYARRYFVKADRMRA